LEKYMNGDKAKYCPTTSTLTLGGGLPPVQVPAEDRNRTSPFPYGNQRFEFRAVGSSQNTSLVNIVLNSMVAKVFKEFSEAIEAGASPTSVAQAALKEHWKIIFNGDGYDTAEQDKLIANGLCHMDSSVDAICTFTAPKNLALFEEMAVFKPEECHARQLAMLEHYAGVIEIELGVMIDLINQHIIPSCKNANVGPIAELYTQVQILQDAMASFHAEGDAKKKAELARVIRMETMMTARVVCDNAESVVPADLWTLATYKELLLSRNYQGNSKL